jgi:transposase
LRPIVRRTWAPKGQTPILKSAAIRWLRRSVAGLIKCSPLGRNPELYLRIFKDTIRTKEIILFLKEIRRHIKGKLILLWDRLRSHRSKELKEFLETQKHWLMVEYLPPYAPELNPVEYLWSAGKKKDLANLYAETLTDIDASLRRYKRRIKRHPKLLTGFLKASTLY